MRSPAEALDVDRIVARRLDEHRWNMQRTVDGIKHLAESHRSAAG